MKASFVLALPALALAAATPQVEERQVPGLDFPTILDLLDLDPSSLLKPECLLKITGAKDCVNGGVDPTTIVADLASCSIFVIISAVKCVAPA
ncbi:hypothetical protein NW762_014207 [Fusarium torreyae]|uniref:Hydrophobin n=1 Tax=Fusarium torreyae TaxID=1237075 RepID=A0A9W8RKC6_9HYPO|nr:hypothetical protein NW762_014207 [Fusarium torreyae]